MSLWRVFSVKKHYLGNLADHVPHAPARPIYRDLAPLFGDVESVVWADLFRSMVEEIQRYFSLVISPGILYSEAEFLEALISRLDFRGVPVQPEWNLATLHALKTFQARYGYEIHPVEVSLSPPNSIVVPCVPYSYIT